MGPSFGTEWEAMTVSFTTGCAAGSPRHAREPDAGLPEDGPAIPEPGSGGGMLCRLWQDVRLVLLVVFLSENRGTPFFGWLKSSFSHSPIALNCRFTPF